MNGEEFARTVVACVVEFCASHEANHPAYSYVPLETDERRIRVMQSRLFDDVRPAEIFGAWLKTASRALPQQRGQEHSAGLLSGTG